MPGFPQLPYDDMRAIQRYVLYGENAAVQSKPGAPSPIDLKFGIDGYNKFSIRRAIRQFSRLGGH